MHRDMRLTLWLVAIPMAALAVTPGDAAIDLTEQLEHCLQYRPLS